MKKLSTFIVMMICVLFSACELLDFRQERDMDVSFTLTDTLGNSATVFHSGENFILTLSLINTLEDTVFYGVLDSGPMAVLQIFSNDSLVASSNDGWDFYQVIVPCHIAPGDTQSVSWIAPQTPAQYPLITALEPGLYSAVAEWNIREISECPLDDHPDPIAFTIVR